MNRILRQVVMAGMLAVPLLIAEGAKASDYCREYTRTITIGGVRQSGYGTACYQPDGSWQIVSLEGANQARQAVRDDIRYDLVRADPQVVIVERAVPVTYYAPVRPYPYPVYSRTAVSYWPWGYTRYHDRSRGWDRDDRRGPDRHDHRH
jgi:hypothetical protein